MGEGSVHRVGCWCEGYDAERDFERILKYMKILKTEKLFYVYGSVHHNIFYEITNRCSYMQSILFHC